MASDTFECSYNSDDGECNHDGSGFTNSTLQHYIGKQNAASMRTFFRFLGVTIPSGSTITAAKLTVRCYAARSGNTVNLKVHCEAADNPSAPSDGSDLIGRSLTTGTAWDAVEAMAFGVYYDTVDFTSDLQEVIDRGGWASGQAVTVHILDNGSTYNDHRVIGGAYLAGYEADLVVEWDEAGAPDIIGVNTESFGIGEVITAEYPFIGEQVESLALSDIIDALDTSIGLDESVSFSQWCDYEVNIVTDVAESFGLSDASEGHHEYEYSMVDSFGMSDFSEAFNYAEWIKQNESIALTRFYFTLTSSPIYHNGDIEIDISNFSAIKKSGEATILQVTIKDFSYAQEIADRSHSEMVIELGYIVGQEVAIREEILRAGVEFIDIYKGAENRSIVLRGSRTDVYSANLVRIDEKHLEMDSTVSNIRRVRFSKIDPYLNPGDTLLVGNDSIVVETITYYVSQNSQRMEIKEA